MQEIQSHFFSVENLYLYWLITDNDFQLDWLYIYLFFCKQMYKDNFCYFKADMLALCFFLWNILVNLQMFLSILLVNFFLRVLCSSNLRARCLLGVYIVTPPVLTSVSWLTCLHPGSRMAVICCWCWFLGLIYHSNADM